MKKEQSDLLSDVFNYLNNYYPNDGVQFLKKDIHPNGKSFIIYTYNNEFGENKDGILVLFKNTKESISKYFLDTLKEIEEFTNRQIKFNGRLETFKIDKITIDKQYFQIICYQI